MVMLLKFRWQCSIYKQIIHTTEKNYFPFLSILLYELVIYKQNMVHLVKQNLSKSGDKLRSEPFVKVT